MACVNGLWGMVGQEIWAGCERKRNQEERMAAMGDEGKVCTRFALSGA